MELILAASACDPESQIICTPASVNELFELPFLGGINRTMILTVLAALLVVWFFWAAFPRGWWSLRFSLLVGWRRE